MNPDKRMHARLVRAAGVSGLLFAALLAPHALAAQLRIELEPVGELRLQDAPANIRPTGALAARADGRLFVLAPGGLGASEIFVFDERGRYVRSLGQRGGGPREYRGITSLTFDRADSLWVFDRQNQRLDVYDPDLRYVRGMPVTGAGRNMMALPGGGVLIAGGGHGFDGDQLAITLVRGGAVAMMPVGRGDNAANELRVIPSPDGGLWVALRYEYGFRLMSLDGTLRRTMGTEPAWWRSARADPRFASLMAVIPSIANLGLDGAGNLWVSTVIPTP
jgi:hypothetical protein